MPLVSVIVPNYNHSRFLRQRLDSIFAQTFQDFEVILLDDCSTDESEEVLAHYATHEKVSHFIVNEKNSGSTFKQWKKGLDLAKGTYIWIAESDDWADEHFLEVLVANLKEETSCQVAFCLSKKIDEKGSDLGIWEDHFTRALKSERFVLKREEAIEKFMLNGNCIPNASGVLVHRVCFQYLDHQVQSMVLNGDWLFWIKILEHTNIMCINSELNYFRQQENSVRNKQIASGRNLLEYFDIINYLYAKSIEKSHLIKTMHNIVSSAQALHYRRRIDEEVFKGFMERAKRHKFSSFSIHKTLALRLMKRILN